MQREFVWINAMTVYILSNPLICYILLYVLLYAYHQSIAESDCQMLLYTISKGLYWKNQFHF